MKQNRLSVYNDLYFEILDSFDRAVATAEYFQRAAAPEIPDFMYVNTMLPDVHKLYDNFDIDGVLQQDAYLDTITIGTAQGHFIKENPITYYHQIESDCNCHADIGGNFFVPNKTTQLHMDLKLGVLDTMEMELTPLHQKDLTKPYDQKFVCGSSMPLRGPLLRREAHLATPNAINHQILMLNQLDELRNQIATIALKKADLEIPNLTLESLIRY
jgi:hypothetical protein